MQPPHMKAPRGGFLLWGDSALQIIQCCFLLQLNQLVTSNIVSLSVLSI